MSDTLPVPAPDGIPIESNRELAIRRFQQVWNERRTETSDELLRPGAIGHAENGDQGPTEFKAARAGAILVAFNTE